MYGFSIVSYIEILYYLTGKGFVYIYRSFLLDKEPNNRNYSLYWRELMPKIRRNLPRQEQLRK